MIKFRDVYKFDYSELTFKLHFESYTTKYHTVYSTLNLSAPHLRNSSRKFYIDKFSNNTMSRTRKGH